MLSIAAQTAEALREAHEQDITHRDIKSENIMVTPRGQSKVIDFGLAKLKGASTLTKIGFTMSIIACRLPAQARAEEVDHRTDIWSLVGYSNAHGTITVQRRANCSTSRRAQPQV